MAMNRKAAKILVVDDDENLLVSLKRLLTLSDYDIYTAENAKKGLKLLESLKPDLIILDLAMPGISGLGFLKQITGPDGKIRYPVLILTARAHMGDFFSGIDVDGFLEKPCSSETLESEIERILNKHSKQTQTIVEPTAKSLRPQTATVAGKILLAEDDPEISARLEHDLKKAGYVVEIVTDGSEIVEKAILAKPNAIVIKRILRGMNGDKVAVILGDMPTTNSIPVVLYSEGDDPETVNRFLSKSPNIRSSLADSTSGHIISAVKSLLQ